MDVDSARELKRSGLGEKRIAGTLYVNRGDLISILNKGAAPGKEAQKKGGSRRTYYQGLQSFINWLAAEFKNEGKLLTPPTLKDWLVENAIPEEGYDPTPEIPDCADIEFDEPGLLLLWKDDAGSQKGIKIKSVTHYINRANRQV